MPASSSGSAGAGLTRYQLLIWSGQELHPDTPLFSNAAYEIVEQAVDREHLARAWGVLLRQADALRTVIVQERGLPRQHVLDDLPWRVNWFDLSAHADPEAALGAWAEERSQALFDLGRRLFDLALVSLGSGRCAIYLNVHHVVCDAWANAVIVRRLAEYYALSLQGRLAEALVPLPQFGRYLEFEAAQVRSARAARAAAHWRRDAGPAAEPLAFYGRPCRVRGTRVSRSTLVLGEQRSQRLRAVALPLGRRGGADAALHAFFGAVVLLFLRCATGSTWITLGSPFHNRRGWEDVIGLLMQIVPLTVEVRAEDSPARLMDRLTSAHLRALRHRDWAVGNPDTQRLYDVEYNYIPSVVPRFLGQRSRRVWLHPGHSKNPLAIQLYDDGDERYLCAFDFHHDVFDSICRERVLADFAAVLDAALEAPDRPLDERRPGGCAPAPGRAAEGRP
jgi:hypothetical protein